MAWSGTTYTEKASSSASLSGFNPFKSKGFYNIFYNYAGSNETTIKYSNGGNVVSYTNGANFSAVNYVQAKTISGYKNESSSIVGIVPGAFPQFDLAWSTTALSSISDSYAAYDISSHSCTTGADELTFHQDGQYLYITSGVTSTSDKSITYTRYAASHFKDNTVPTRLLIVLQGGGGGGGGGGKGAVFGIGGGDGSGGAGGGAVIVGLSIADGNVYTIDVGAAGDDGGPCLSGGAGGNTILSQGGTQLAIAYGGEGGFKGEWSGDTGTAAGGGTSVSSDSRITSIFAGSGGSGGPSKTGVAPGACGGKTIVLAGHTASVGINSFAIRGGAGGAWGSDGTGFCGPGGASYFGDGGRAGNNAELVGSTTCAGGAGAGGGGGRYCWEVGSYGGYGGKGFAAIFC